GRPTNRSPCSTSGARMRAPSVLWRMAFVTNWACPGWSTDGREGPATVAGGPETSARCNSPSQGFGRPDGGRGRRARRRCATRLGAHGPPSRRRGPRPENVFIESIGYLAAPGLWGSLVYPSGFGALPKGAEEPATAVQICPAPLADGPEEQVEWPRNPSGNGTRGWPSSCSTLHGI